MKRIICIMYLMAFVCLFLASCSKNEDDEPNQEVTIVPTSITLFAGDTKQLYATNAISWGTSDDFIAEVDNKGLVTGSHVGTTTITAQNGNSFASCKVTVAPKYDLYDTPILDWGASISSIQSKETHSKSSSSNSTMLAYNYSKNGSSYALFYYFEEGKMSRIVVYMDLLQYITATEYLQERYVPLYAEKSNYFLMFADAYEKAKIKTIVGIQTTTVSNTELTMVSYIPAN